MNRNSRRFVHEASAVAFLFLHSKRAGSETDQEIHIVGLDLCLVCRLVADRCAALLAAVRNDKALFIVGLASDGAENTAAGILAVARQNIDVQRTEAEGAMVARGVPERQNLFSAACAEKSAVIFLKSLGFHKKFLS